jgi:hypothetical protein
MDTKKVKNTLRRTSSRLIDIFDYINTKERLQASSSPTQNPFISTVASPSFLSSHGVTLDSGNVTVQSFFLPAQTQQEQVIHNPSDQSVIIANCSAEIAQNLFRNSMSSFGSGGNQSRTFVGICRQRSTLKRCVNPIVIFD